MINVLPESGREAVRKEYYLRLAVLALVSLGGVSLVVAASFMPAYLEGREERESLKEQLELAEIAAAREAESFVAKDIAFAGKALPVIETNLSVARPSLYIAEVLEARSSAVLISQIEFEGGEGPMVRVSGTALTRDALLAFSRRLSQARGAPTVDLPVSNLAKNENAPFFLTVQFSQPL